MDVDDGQVVSGGEERGEMRGDWEFSVGAFVRTVGVTTGFEA